MRTPVILVIVREQLGPVLPSVTSPLDPEAAVPHFRVEDILLVAGAVHECLHHLLNRVLSTSDVLSRVPSIIPGTFDPSAVLRAIFSCVGATFLDESLIMVVLLRSLVEECVKFKFPHRWVSMAALSVYCSKQAVDVMFLIGERPSLFVIGVMPAFSVMAAVVGIITGHVAVAMDVADNSFDRRTFAVFELRGERVENGEQVEARCRTQYLPFYGERSDGNSTTAASLNRCPHSKIISFRRFPCSNEYFNRAIGEHCWRNCQTYLSCKRIFPFRYAKSILFERHSGLLVRTFCLIILARTFV